MALTILLARHGETEWNKINRYQGWRDSPLTEKGIAQAQAIGRALCALTGSEDTELVASPIGRARRTAEIIRAILDDRLREISLGSWEGTDRTEILARAPGIFDGDGHYEWYFNTPDGDTYDAFKARVADWLFSADEKPVIVVTHGIVSRVLRGIYADLPRATALRLPVAQNRVFRLADRMIEELQVESTKTGSG